MEGIGTAVGLMLAREKETSLGRATGVVVKATEVGTAVLVSSRT
jgi:hypothetical protein